MRPQVEAVRIYSEGATSLSYVAENTAVLDVYRVEADTYGEAKDTLTKTVLEWPHFAWCRSILR